MQFVINLPLESQFLRSSFPAVRGTLDKATHTRLRRAAVQAFQHTRRFVLSGIVLGFFVFAIATLIPKLYFASTTPAEIKYQESIAQHVSQAETIQEVSPAPQERYMPPLDTSLPEGSWVSIPRIGVFTQLQPTQSPEEALATGVWQVPDFGTPGSELDDPIILAAHRFGWQWWWQSDYWKYHSFYNLPTTEVGDRVEIIHDQRKWVYEIYNAHEGDAITDYDNDLILYTCKHLKSPIRHFRYARLVEQV